MKIEYARKTAKSFPVAVQAVQEACERHDFQVKSVHEISRELGEHGFVREPLTVVKACNTRYASEVTAKDVRFAMLMPCPFLVHESDHQVWVTVMLPSAMAGMFPDADLGRIASEVEQVFKAIVDEATA